MGQSSDYAWSSSHDDSSSSLVIFLIIRPFFLAGVEAEEGADRGVEKGRGVDFKEEEEEEGVERKGWRGRGKEEEEVGREGEEDVREVGADPFFLSLYAAFCCSSALLAPGVERK